MNYCPLFLFDLITKVQDVSLSPPIAKKNTVAQSPTLLVFLVVIFLILGIFQEFLQAFEVPLSLF